MFLALMFITGLVFGSFCNLVVDRYQPGTSLPRYFRLLAFPPSHCIYCCHPLSWKDLIPLLSYLWSRGRCRYCGQALHLILFYGELLCGTIFLSCAMIYPFDFQQLAVTGYCCFLFVLARIDHLFLCLPNGLVLPLLLSGLLLVPLFPTITFPERVVGLLMGYFLLSLINLFYSKIYCRQGIGGGDMKLLAALGAWNGWQSLAEILLFASLGTLLVVLLCGQLSQSLKDHRPLPFGVGLSAAGIFWRLWQDAISGMTGWG